MNMGAIGGFAGGLSSGYLAGQQDKRQQAGVDLAKRRDTRDQQAFDADFKSNQELGQQLAALGYTSLAAYLGKAIPQVSTPPLADNSVPGLTKPVGPAAGIKMPTFGAY